MAVSFSYSTEYDMSIGATYSDFRKEFDSEKTSVSQFVLPYSYALTYKDIKGYVASCYSLTLPYLIDNEVIEGSKEQFAGDTRIGTVFPILKNKMLGTVSCVLPIGSQKLGKYDSLAEASLLSPGFEFRQSRFRDGAKWNIGLAYIQKSKNLYYNLGFGYFINSEYENINPGDFVLFSGGLTAVLGNGWVVRNDFTYCNNFSSYINGIKVAKQGNSITDLLSAKKKLDDKRYVDFRLNGGINARNMDFGRLENKNSNRNSVGLDLYYDAYVWKSSVFTGTAGVEHLFKNEVNNVSSAVFKVSQTQGYLGVKTKSKLRDNFELSTSGKVYYGSNSLQGISIGAFISYKIK